MYWIKGRTTARSLLKKLQALEEKDLDRNLLVITPTGVCQPYNITKADDNNYTEYKESLILELATVSSRLNEDTNANTPDPIIKDGKAICPCCGKEVVRSPEVYLTRIPIYTYYCTKCIYWKEIMQKEPIPEVRVHYLSIPDSYLNQEER